VDLLNPACRQQVEPQDMAMLQEAVSNGESRIRERCVCGGGGGEGRKGGSCARDGAQKWARICITNLTAVLQLALLLES
jgi:hypothetical protein